MTGLSTEVVSADASAAYASLIHVGFIPRLNGVNNRVVIDARRRNEREEYQLNEALSDYVSVPLEEWQLCPMLAVAQAVCHAMNAGVSPALIQDMMLDITEFGERYGSAVVPSWEPLGINTLSAFIPQYAWRDQDSGHVILITPGQECVVLDGESVKTSDLLREQDNMWCDF